MPKNASGKPRKRARYASHIPALPPERLNDALARVQATALTAQTKRVLTDMLKAAANRDSETPEVVIRSLPAERRVNIQDTQQQLHRQTAGVVQRGGKALLEMDEAEFQRLLEDSEDE